MVIKYKKCPEQESQVFNDQCIISYVRHIFVSRYYLILFSVMRCDGESTEFIKKALGHAEIKAAENYYDSVWETNKGEIQMP